jgi:hypothetical protein
MLLFSADDAVPPWDSNKIHLNDGFAQVCSWEQFAPGNSLLLGTISGSHFGKPEIASLDLLAVYFRVTEIPDE